MKAGKRAWIYCHIDAPEDTHGALKGHLEELEQYCKQMGFVVAGHSDDMGNAPPLKRPGINAFLSAAKDERIEVLVIHHALCISLHWKQRMEFFDRLLAMQLEVISPLEGYIIGNV